MKPKGVLIDCGGTLLDEIAVRRALIDKEVVVRRDQCRMETPWTVITRLIYDHFGLHFKLDWESLELGFWQASMTTKAMDGAKEALKELALHGIPAGVLSNSIYRPSVLIYELGKQGLAEHLRFVMSSAEHGVRKPDPLIFELAAAKLEVQPADIWFVGDKLEVDVHGAESAGMTPVWFKPQQQVPMPCAGVTDWHAFLRLCRTP